jgi:hypothetical protein
VFTTTAAVAPILAAKHYLGPARRGLAWIDEHGVLVLGPPTSRSLPREGWLELSRWCITAPGKNVGSKQWAGLARALFEQRPELTTIVSYSDPAAGHDGALYRASGWVWAPTWHRLRPPPSGGGSWDGGKTIQAPKDRWVYCLRPDELRRVVFVVRDSAIMRRHPWLVWQEPRTKRGRCLPNDGGIDRKRWTAHVVG